MNNQALKTAYDRFDLGFSQEQMQQYLGGVAQQEGLRSALDALNRWEYEVGYITDSKLHDNQRYAYPDPETGVTFTTQINIARSRYTPKPLSGKNIPKLHCPICIDNVGIPGKEDLRVFEFDLREGKRFFCQLTPFPLFERHFVLIARERVPMQMSVESIADLTAFIDAAPGYVGCSNSDVEWAGASVLQHHHYQVIDALHLPIMEARVQAKFSYQGDGWQFGLLDFPIACAKVEATDVKKLIQYGGDMIAKWKAQDPGRNTCNLVVRHTEKGYELYIIFRNPDYRTPEALTPIKSEGVGIIEVAGEGIYPVPTGEHADVLWQQIEQDGLAVIKGIIAGNSPVPKERQAELFNMLCLG